MNDLVHPRERTLGTITLVLGVTIWIALFIGTIGTILVALGLGFLIYVFAHSALIAYIKGNGVELTIEQFPDLNAHLTECCERLQIKPRPEVYILNGNGGFNAFATRFLGTEFVVLLSDVVDAMEGHPDGIRFYIGHELGHLRMKHLTGALLRWPVLWLPLLGAAYARAKESTCDRHGLACSSSPENAARALAALSTGGKRWKQLDVPAYIRQTRNTDGFWMSFHELTAAYPYLTKRAARVMDSNVSLPRRSKLAYLLAAFVPYTGRLAAGAGSLVMVYIILAMLSAVGIPAFVSQIRKSRVGSAVHAVQPSLDALTKYYAEHQRGPGSLEEAGLAAKLPSGENVAFDANQMTLTIRTNYGEIPGTIVFTPALDAERKVTWTCSGTGGVKAEWLPESCRGAAPSP